jgi:enamine deaminase RidA (YjgF/YER057c/UK114 family)
MDANKFVATYIKMRDAKVALTREFETKVNEIEEQMQLVEQALLEICKSTGQDGGKTMHGTFTRTVKTRYWTNNWDAMYSFIKSHDAVQLLEQRIHQGNMKQFLQENPGTLPEGLNADARYAITVRRSSK